jgi:hypothetical protein
VDATRNSVTLTRAFMPSGQTFTLTIDRVAFESPDILVLYLAAPYKAELLVVLRSSE